MRTIQGIISTYISRFFFCVLIFGAAFWFLGPYRQRLSTFPVSIPGHERPYPPPTSQAVWTGRADQVKAAFLHAYSNYKTKAAPHDELLPVSGRPIDNFNGWSVSVVDALDTMWIMGFHDEFMASLPVIASITFAMDTDSYAPFFETIIRYLGGFLSAYALSGEPLLLARADDLATKLLPAFSAASGLPRYAVNTVTGAAKPGWEGIAWAEATSCQMEFKYLAHLTGRTQYYEAVEKIMGIMYSSRVPQGLFPTLWDLKTGTPANNHLSIGAFADSGYEYILKQWLLSGRSETKARDQYLQSVKGILDNLFYLTPVRQLLYVTDVDNGKPSYVMEHLSCFFPGLLVLGAQMLDISPADKEKHMWAAEGLAYTCWILYEDMKSGLCADELLMDRWPTQNAAEGYDTGRWREHLRIWESNGRPGQIPPGLKPVAVEPDKEKRDYTLRKDEYLLRPEAIESFYYLWKATGQEVWRDRAWAIFEAIQKNTKISNGYASIEHVDADPPSKKDSMPSYFFAETLKYLYLMFINEEPIPLNTWVFNTEGHPFPVFNWTEGEKTMYGI